MQKVPERSTLPFVKYAGSDCAAAVSANRSSIDCCVSATTASRRGPRKAACVDSESQILAMKKFSCLTDISVVAIAKTDFSDESRLPDSEGWRLLVRRAARDQRPTLGPHRSNARRPCRRLATFTWQIQMPSL